MRAMSTRSKPAASAAPRRPEDDTDHRPEERRRPTAATTTWRTAPTRTISVGGTPFVYRELGPRTGVPLVFLHHFTAVLDDWDPRVIDGIAAKRHVIAFDNRGITWAV